MKVVALISGGKDSCYNMLECIQAGHEIVALANLRPENKDELDSFMYQTVGHQGVELYAEAMNVPLFRHMTTGVALRSEKSYIPTPKDEVEDLYQLLVNVKEQVNIEAVAVGAVLSDYQRLRVENVCSRLGLVALAYLWRRDQAQLLQEMIDYNIDAIVIKVAALGLDPAKHLGMRISEIQPHLIKMNEKYGLNICGEGGEYETFTLDCPFFSKSLLIDDYETVIHSNDAFAPVGYLNFRKLRLVDKEGVDADTPLIERLKGFSAKCAEDYINDIDQPDLTDTDSDSSPPDRSVSVRCPEDEMAVLEMKETEPASGKPSFVANGSGWCWLGGIVGNNADIELATIDALNQLKCLLEENGLSVSSLVCVTVYVREMGDYGRLNAAYLRVITGPDPPVRICVGTELHESTPVVVHALAYAATHRRQTMHVQALSHWAPANIGPYSQLVKIDDIVYVAGQIGVIPGWLEVVGGGVKRECRLALRHIARLVKATDKDFQLRDVVLGICYVTSAGFIAEVRKEWERRSNNAIVDYIVVAQLPKAALVEWQVWLHRGNTRFEYEETGCVVGENRVSLRRRWNYDNTVSVVVCHVSTATSISNPVISESGVAPKSGESLMNDVQLGDVLRYTLSRLFKGIVRHDGEQQQQQQQNDNENDKRATSDGSTIEGWRSGGGGRACCSLVVFYRAGRAPACRAMYNAIAGLAAEYDAAATVVPVRTLTHPNTFISICGVRHQ